MQIWWDYLRGITLSDKSQTQKATYSMVPLIQDILEKAKPIRTKPNQSCQSLVVAGRCSLQGHFGDNENVLFGDGGYKALCFIKIS